MMRLWINGKEAVVSCKIQGIVKFRSHSRAWRLWRLWLALPNMKYIAAYLLAQLGGDAAPSKDKVKAILESVGIAVDDKAIDALFGKLEGKNVEELIEEGASKLTVVGGGGAAAPAAGAGAGAAAEEKKEEEKKEEEALEMAGGFDDLFG